MSDGIDPKLVQKINHILAESGERERYRSTIISPIANSFLMMTRLKEMLRRKLEDSGWTQQVRKQCECKAQLIHRLFNFAIY
jgi:hypothetical protein